MAQNNENTENSAASTDAAVNELVHRFAAVVASRDKKTAEALQRLDDDRRAAEERANEAERKLAKSKKEAKKSKKKLKELNGRPVKGAPASTF